MSSVSGSEVNVALGKTYDQSSAYNSSLWSLSPASFAANNNTDGTYGSTNCIHTDSYDPGWWQVDLGTVYPLYNFKVWGRTGCE